MSYLPLIDTIYFIGGYYVVEFFLERTTGLTMYKNYPRHSHTAQISLWDRSIYKIGILAERVF